MLKKTVLICIIIASSCTPLVNKQMRFDKLLQDAQGGNDQAMFQIGIMMLKGGGTNKDIDNGLAWLAKAANCGNREAKDRLVVTILESSMSIKECTQWLELLERSVKQEWLVEAAMKGNPIAKIWMAYYLFDHPQEKVATSVINDITKTVLKCATKKTNPFATYFLGAFCYAEGWGGFARDSKKAEAWVRNAAELGILDAQFDLGNVLAESDIITTKKEGLIWLKRAYEGGYSGRWELERRIKEVETELTGQ